MQVIKANFSQIESQGNDRKNCSEKCLLHLKESVVVRPNTTNLHLLCKTQRVVQHCFPPPYLFIWQSVGALVCLVFTITLFVMDLLTHTTEKATEGCPPANFI